MTSIEQSLTDAQTQVAALKSALSTVVIGQEQVLDEVLWALLACGNVLLEGAPGLGKTLLVKTLSNCLDLSFSRIQFTPDLMPGDITGGNVLLLDEQGHSTGRFELHRGPLFAQLVLADEINRASPKTQSALLEAMQEGSVTISGTRHQLPSPFMVLATENPIEMEGTYPLPEAQLDRFLFKIMVPSPTPSVLESILAATTGHASASPTTVIQRAQLLELQSLCRDVAVPQAVLHYASRITTATDPMASSSTERVRTSVRFGAGVRGGQALILGGKARALSAGRPNVSFEDVRAVAKPALRHRLLLSFESESLGLSCDDVLSEVVDGINELPPEVEQRL